MNITIAFLIYACHYVKRMTPEYISHNEPAQEGQVIVDTHGYIYQSVSDYSYDKVSSAPSFTFTWAKMELRCTDSGKVNHG